MEGDPALVVRLVDAGSVLHQESHHVNVVVYARLQEKRARERKERERQVKVTGGAGNATCRVRARMRLCQSLIERHVRPE